MVSVPNLFLQFVFQVKFGFCSKFASLIWFLCQIYFFNLFSKSNLVSVPNLILYFLTVLTFIFSYFGHLLNKICWVLNCWRCVLLLKKSLNKGLFKFQFQKYFIKIQFQKVNSSKLSIPRFEWTDCQSHQAKTGSFASNSTPEV